MDAEVDAGGRDLAGERCERGGGFGDLPPHGGWIVEAATTEHVPVEPAFRPDPGGRADGLLEGLCPVGNVHPGAGPLREAGGGEPPGRQRRKRRVEQVLHHEAREIGERRGGGVIDPGGGIRAGDPGRVGLPLADMLDKLVP